MKAATAAEAREIDRIAIGHFGIPGISLMERAGVAVARHVRASYTGKRALIIAGTGNNGGDGLVAARELNNLGMRVQVLMPGRKGKLAADCAAQLAIVKKLRIPVSNSSEITQADLHGAVVIDALFGIGLARKVEGALAALITRVNDSSSPVVAVDIPSGICADTGLVLGAAIKADMTVTFGLPKRGHLLYPGADHTGALHVEDIGFPHHLYDDVTCDYPDDAHIGALIPRRPRASHKGDFGHVLVIAGSSGKTGAAFMAASACMRAGTGLVTIGGPVSLRTAYEARAVEEMYLPLADDGDGSLTPDAIGPALSFIAEQADALLIGPGIGRSKAAQEFCRELIIRCPAPMVIDADALYAIDRKLLSDVKAPVVLTPHPGEFTRLTGMSKDAVRADRVSAAQKLNADTGATVILKGAPTVIADSDGRVAINPTGGPALAKAGTGDVLAGIVAAWFGQGLGPGDAARIGVYCHGLAADIALADGSEHSVLASDVIEHLPAAYARLEGEA